MANKVTIVPELDEDDGSLLSAESILEAEDLEVLYLDVPAWGGRVKIKQLTADAAIEFLDTLKGPARKTAQARIVLKSVVDGEDKPLFTDKQLNHLKRKSLKTLNEVANECLILNGLNKEKDEGLEDAGNE